MTARATAPIRPGFNQSDPVATDNAVAAAAARIASPITVVVRRECLRSGCTAGVTVLAGSGRSQANGATPSGSHAGGLGSSGANGADGVSIRGSGGGDFSNDIGSVWAAAVSGFSTSVGASAGPSSGAGGVLGV